MLRNIHTRALLLAGFLIAGLLPLIVVTLMSYEAGRHELKAQAFQHLESVRDIQRDQVSRFFEARRHDVAILARDPTLILAFGDLCAAYREAGGAASGTLVGRDHRRFDAPPGYRKIHDRHLPFLSRYVDELGYYDLLLLDAPDGETCFSVEKERDFAAVVARQPTALRDVWQEAVERRSVALSDTRPYPPSANAAAQFIAAPVEEPGTGRVLGVVALQISVAGIDAIMSERSGLGRTGECWLAGPDLRMRSDSTLDHARSVEASFRPGGALVDLPATRRALAGETGSALIPETDGRAVLSAWVPLEVSGTRWALVAEIDEREIDAQIDRALNAKVAVLLVSSIVAVVVLALLISTAISRGIRSVGLQLGQLSDAALAGNLDARVDPLAVSTDFRDVVGKVNGLVEVFVRAIRDVSRMMDEKQQLEDRISRMQRLEAIGTLAGGIAHDFNNILTYLFAYADIAQSLLPEGSPASPHLVQIVAGTQRAADLVGQILTFSRQVHGQTHPLDLAPLVKETLKLAAASVPGNIQVVTAIPARPFPVVGNPTQVHQLTANLLSNALDAMKDLGGTLTVTLDDPTIDKDDPRVSPPLRPGPYCVLEVRDTGHGMDERTLGRIFEPFFTTKPVGKGTGMGLALVHGIATAAGGGVQVQSLPDHGSTFRVYLPRTDALAAKAPEPAAPAPRSARQRVLFIDDETNVCEVGRQMLESLGHHAETFESGGAALARFREAPDDFDAVITDLHMPDISGFEVAAAVRALRPTILIVLATAYAERVTVDQARAQGIAELLLKPYRRSDLLRILSAPRA